MDKFLDKNIYDKAKKIADAKYKKNSAYKSMYMIEKYKELGGKINPKAEKKSGTKIWLKEKWKNLTPLALGLETKINNLPVCGAKHPKQGKNPSICRPTVKITKDTPVLAQSYTLNEIKIALKKKKKGKRIDWSEL